MAPHSLLEHLMYWKHKSPGDNLWHPIPREVPRSPVWKRIDIEAAVVDIAPFVAGAGAFAYMRQINDFGFTTTASVFGNRRTVLATHRASLVMAGAVLGLQVAGIEYRQYIPRWASDRESRRDDEEARQHIDAGMIAGLGILLTRTILRKGPSPSLMDVILGGALGDVLLREYFRAHNL
ncbi:hypothetical protein AMS68_008051 [Peltaster fructicola]|uniref:Uncharacterized protein n=1 Tax=Peltaster fructicola TaxID=286661 RepID=A0A6H0Y677_9PEZI|nr:hypothetical protein AMS68_008051 [Peltaster fructicola]